MNRLTHLLNYHKKKIAYYKKVLGYIAYYEPEYQETFLKKLEYHLEAMNKLQRRSIQSVPKTVEYPEDVKRIIEEKDLNVNWDKATIDYSEIYKIHRRKDIVYEDAIEWAPPTHVNHWIEDREPVVVVELNGEVKAYPIKLLLWNPVINDTLAGKPIVVIYCPLCNLTTAYIREVKGKVLCFGVSGFVRNSCMVLYDSDTHSLWDAVKGEAIVGDYTGAKLERILMTSTVPYECYKKNYPDGPVAKQVSTSPISSIGKNPYVAYDEMKSPMFLTKEPDDRLPSMERVVGIVIDKRAICYPYKILREKRVIEDTFQKKALVIFYRLGMVSPVNDTYVMRGKEIGATGVFSPFIDGTHLEFYEKDNRFYDKNTGSQWSILGKGLKGELRGKQLAPIKHKDLFWYAWAAYHPDTVIYSVDN